jgi:hypothetical protein
MTRTAGKRGLRRSTPHPELRLKSNLTAPIPTAPPTGDVTSGITAFGMDGNDQHSDCGAAALDHYMVTKAGLSALIGQLGGVGPLALYFEYGTAMGEPGAQPDQGVDNATWLKFLYDKKIIEGFVQLDPKDLNEVRYMMNETRGCLVGVELTADAEQLFGAHQEWTVADGETPDQNEGHDILLVKYGPEGDTFVTWGALQLAGVNWDADCITDVWAVLTQADATRLGVAWAPLIATIESLGGTTT